MAAELNSAVGLDLIYVIGMSSMRSKVRGVPRYGLTNEDILEFVGSSMTGGFVMTVIRQAENRFQVDVGRRQRRRCNGVGLRSRVGPIREGVLRSGGSRDGRVCGNNHNFTVIATRPIHDEYAAT
jgi:hypothetical protein